MKAKTRRTKTSHPGVKLLERTRGEATTFYARFTDPDTGRPVDMNLTRLGLTSEPARVDWARRKSQALAKRRADLASGAPRATGLALAKALEDYLAHVAASKRPATVAAYRPAVERFATWAKANGLETVDVVTPADLARFREELTASRRRAAVKGETRGKRAEDGKRLALASQASYLATVRVALNHLRRLGRLPLVPSGEALKEALKPVRVEREEPEILRAPEVRRLLEAALALDDKRQALGRPATPGRPAVAPPPPVAPAIAFLLLTGARVGEALALEWRSVDLDACDDGGRAVGAVRFRAATTKTRRWREVDFAPCPSLRRLLRGLRVRSGDTGRVFGNVSVGVLKAAWKRMRRAGAPPSSPHTLRRTAGTFLTNAPGIYHAASAFMSAKRLGHAVAVAERCYVGLVRGIDPKATTLEVAYGCPELFERIADRATGLEDTRAEAAS